MAKILLVDDDAGVREIARVCLMLLGHQVVEAAQGREALEVLASEPVDLLLTDLVMPEMDGLELILEVRKLFPALAVVAMSGGGRSSIDDLLLMAGQFGVRITLAKPFTKQALADAIKQAL